MSERSNYYRPRMLARLTVPLMGTRAQRIKQEASTEAINLVVHPKSIKIESNDFNHADSATLVCDWLEVGVDARVLDNACVEIYVDNADSSGFWTPSKKNCRFIGLTKEITVSRDGDNSAEVSIDLLDFTTLFIEARPFGSSGIPRLDQRLDEAWRTIIDGMAHRAPDGTVQSNPAEVLRNALVLEGLDEFPDLGRAVADRFKRLTYVQTEPETDAWAVWQQCVGMCGLISYIRLDKVIVTTATNLYTESDAPVLIWGQNIAEWGESKRSEFSKKGVGITSYNALTGTTIEALWPPIGDKSISQKRATAKKVLSQEEIRKSEDRDYFAFPGVTEQGALLDIAKRVFEERSHQELEGHVRTFELEVDTESGNDFDLLSLAAGDSVVVQIDPESRQLLASKQSDSERKKFLLDRGYSPDAAALIIANMRDYASLESKFLVKSAVFEFHEGSQLSLEFEYVNRLQLAGDTAGDRQRA